MTPDPIWGTWLVILGYVALLVVSLTRDRRTIYRGAPDHAAWRDLRLWILPLVAIQIVLYWLF